MGEGLRTFIDKVRQADDIIEINELVSSAGHSFIISLACRIGNRSKPRPASSR